MDRPTRTVRFEDAEVLEETELAVLCRMLVWKNCWVPKSQVVQEEGTVAAEGDKGPLLVKEWWVSKARMGHDVRTFRSGKLPGRP